MIMKQAEIIPTYQCHFIFYYSIDFRIMLPVIIITINIYKPFIYHATAEYNVTYLIRLPGLSTGYRYTDYVRQVV